jgi:hypothetical protein
MRLVFNVHGPVHHKNILIYIQQMQRYKFILSGICSTCFGWYLHPSSETQTTVSTASGICHTVTATCRYRGRVGTGLSVLWVVYATHSTLRPVPTDISNRCKVTQYILSGNCFTYFGWYLHPSSETV